MNKDIKLGYIFAMKEVKEKINTIINELERKGFEEPKGFSVLKNFVDDCIKQSTM